jgi:hypothetical protein
VSDIQQLQVLSHQSKIATRIEIFVGTAVEGDPRPAYSRAKFKRMGYVSLDPNERSNFQARELKTVQFNANGLFLKLIIHKCSVNRLNIYSQAAPPHPRTTQFALEHSHNLFCSGSNSLHPLFVAGWPHRHQRHRLRCVARSSRCEQRCRRLRRVWRHQPFG